MSAADDPIDPRPLHDPAEIAARDRAWLATVYRRNEPQLTIRAALTGMVLGAVLSASDLYIGLKIGWTFGMSITSSILAFAVFSAAQKLYPGLRPLSVLENNTSQTAASAAAYMSSAGLISSIPAMTMLRSEGVLSIPDLDGVRLCLWLMATAALGVVVAVPLKRTLINAEQLKFPHGVVCAETIRTLHAAGKESLHRTRALVGAAVLAAGLKFVFECRLGVLRGLHDTVAFPGKLRGYSLAAWSFAANTSLVLYAAGAIVGIRIGASILLGAVFTYGLLGPALLDAGVLRVASAELARDAGGLATFHAQAAAAHAISVADPQHLYVALRSKWTVWPGTALMVSAALVGFALRWRTMVRALAGLAGLRRSDEADPLAEVEVPRRWFGAGLLVCGGACVYMQWAWFSIPLLQSVVSVIAAFLLSVVAARAMGETGLIPIGPMGKITQLLFGVLVPGNATANLMAATVTAGAAAHSADLLTEVKTGYLLGGSPRKQVWAQLLGVVTGSFACVPIYFLLATPERLGKELAAPAAVAWASVAKLLKDGPQNLPQHALASIGVAVALGVVLAVIEDRLPPPKKAWVPSASGLGIAMVINFSDSFAIFVGALLAWLLRNRRPAGPAPTDGELEASVEETAQPAPARLGRKRDTERWVVPVASGVLAGEGVMAIVVIAMRDLLHWLPK